MNPQLENAAIEFFKICTPPVMVEAFVFMASQISARDNTHVSFAPNEGVGTDDLLRLFTASTLREQLNTLSFILDKLTEDLPVKDVAPITELDNSIKEKLRKLYVISESDQQVVGIFELCTHAERKDTFFMMRAFVSARADSQIQEVKTQDITIERMHRAYKFCNFNERLEVLFFIIEKWSKSLEALNEETITKADEARADKLREIYALVQYGKVIQVQQEPVLPPKRKRAR